MNSQCLLQAMFWISEPKLLVVFWSQKLKVGYDGFLFSFNYVFLFYVCDFHACTQVHHMHTMPKEARRGDRFPGVVKSCLMPCGWWEPNGSSVRAVRVLNHWDIFLVPGLFILNSKLWKWIFHLWSSLVHNIYELMSGEESKDVNLKKIFF